MHPLTQDYADMLGWEEMVAKTAKVYNGLSPEEKTHTVIITDNYGEGGAFARFGPRYNLPETVCLSSSFALWAPDNITPQTLIYVSDDADVSDLKPLVGSTQLMDTVSDSLAREKGTAIFLMKDVQPKISAIYQAHLKQKLSE